MLSLQVTTHSILGALAYETGGLLIDDGWLRLLGSGHPRLTRTLSDWNRTRAEGYYLVGDDAAGGFFAINGGALGHELESVYYWAPDDLDWRCLGLGFTDFVHAFLTSRIERFYGGLRWPTWRADTRNLSGDQSFGFYPFLWTREGSLERSQREIVPVSEIFDMKVDIADCGDKSLFPTCKCCLVDASNFSWVILGHNESPNPPALEMAYNSGSQTIGIA